MSDSKAHTVTPQEVYTAPWEEPGGDPGFQEAAEKFQARFGDEESEQSAPPSDADGPATADEESEKGSEADESDEEDEGKGEEPPEADDEDEESDEDEDEDPSKGAEPSDDDVIDLGDEKVTRKELKDRGLRLADYTRKTQAVADARREVEAQLDEYRGKLEVVYGVLEKASGPEPDWVKLAQELEPKEFQARKAEWDSHQKQLEAVAREHGKVAEQQRKEFEAARETRIAAESAKLVEAIPTWKDAKVAEKEQGALTDYIVGLGFKTEEIDGVEDHRVLVAFRKAMLYDQGKREEAQVVKELKDKAAKPKDKNLKPGVKRGPGKKSKAAEKRLGDARAKLAQGGDLRDAAAVFAQYVDDGVL